MKIHVKEILIGFIVGILANAAGIYLYIFFFLGSEVEEALRASVENESIGSLIALGAILNFLAFFVFLKKKQIYRARGVIMATIVAALAILISKFI